MSNLQEQIIQMRQNLDEAESSIKSLEAGRKSSSAKARASLQKIKGQSHTLRKSIMDTQKALPVKSRVKTVVATEPNVVAPTVESEQSTEPEHIKKPRKPRAKKTEQADV